MTAHEGLLKLLQAACTKRKARAYIIDGLCNYENWYIWFDVELDEDDPKPGTCDIHIQECGTPVRASGSGFRVVKDANQLMVIQFLQAIGVNYLPEKAKNAFYKTWLTMKKLNTEPQE